MRLGLAEKLVPTRPHSATVFQNAFGLSTYARGNPDGYCGTTILCVQKGGETVLIGDGQVTAGHEVIKHHVRKVRRIGESGVIGGFAGSTADALTLYERLENKLEEYPGQLRRASVELAKAWRTEKYLRRLDAVMIVADKDCMLEITGNGDVIEPDHGVLAVGSGGTYAFAAARALLDVEGLTADDIARKAMEIAADICIYTNDKFTVERLPQPEGEEEDSGGEGPQEG
uniref:ATP-dependent protease subunit HslV n=1 Tax=Chloropicon roscoffensis TaxID=1461544 RepID=A0A7S3CGT4_9CHLO